MTKRGGFGWKKCYLPVIWGTIWYVSKMDSSKHPNFQTRFKPCTTPLRGPPAQWGIPRGYLHNMRGRDFWFGERIDFLSPVKVPQNWGVDLWLGVLHAVGYFCDVMFELILFLHRARWGISLLSKKFKHELNRMHSRRDRCAQSSQVGGPKRTCHGPVMWLCKTSPGTQPWPYTMFIRYYPCIRTEKGLEICRQILANECHLCVICHPRRTDFRSCGLTPKWPTCPNSGIAPRGICHKLGLKIYRSCKVILLQSTRKNGVFWPPKYLLVSFPRILQAIPEIFSRPLTPYRVHNIFWPQRKTQNFPRNSLQNKNFAPCTIPASTKLLPPEAWEIFPPFGTIDA